MNTAIELIARLLPLLPGIIANVTDAVEAWTHGTDLLSKMVSENRDPTPEEWADITTRVNAAHAAIQAL
jgi:hypothetical protein